MRIVLIILLTLFIKISFSQTVKELEYELSYYKSGETWGNKKDIARKLLAIDSLNNDAINYLVEVYGRNDQHDSIEVLFDSLIKHNPNNPELYLLIARERNAHFAGLTFSKRINYLKKAYNIDSTNVEAIYMLGKLYYELFNREYKKNRKKANLEYYAKNSSKYFEILYEQSDNYKETLKYPLLQLANYLKKEKKKNKYKNCNIQLSYFPVYAFMNVPDDWETNYSIDVISFVSGSDFNNMYSGVESAIFSIDWYSKHLKALREPVLSDTLPTKVFRFTWLRTFNNPIVIGIENYNDTVTLYWKVSDGAGGYEPGKIIDDKSKILTLKEWTGIVDKINAIDFWNLPSTENEFFGTDGAQWILEGKELGKYHVVDRWSGGEIGKICLELINLTDLKIKEGDIY